MSEEKLKKIKRILGNSDINPVYCLFIIKQIEQLQQENKGLFVENMKLKDKLEKQRKEYQKTYKDVREEIKELKQQNNILTEFEKWLEKTINYLNRNKESYENYRVQILTYKYCLDKLQELKGVKK